MAEENSDLSVPGAVEAPVLTPESATHYELEVARWEGRVRCVYLNNFRIAGGKPWGGYEPAATWQITMKDIEGAIPEVARVRHQRDQLLAACQQLNPAGVATSNRNVPDNTVIPLDVTMGDIRKLRAAIAQATGEAS